MDSVSDYQLFHNVRVVCIQVMRWPSTLPSPYSLSLLICSALSAAWSEPASLGVFGVLGVLDHPGLLT